MHGEIGCTLQDTYPRISALRRDGAVQDRGSMWFGVVIELCVVVGEWSGTYLGVW